MIKRIIFSLVILLFLFNPLQVLAVEFNINKTEINAYLKENGEVQVEEKHTYEFDSEFNGITRTIIPKEETSIRNFQATENGKPLEVELEDGTYIIYRGGEDETIKIVLTYVIENGLEVYSDMAQFYWPFFDSSNESDYENLTINVHPPKSTNDVIAFGYDEAQDTAHIHDNGSVSFQMGIVGSGENGDIRVAYDSKLFPNTVASIGTIREDVLQEKEQLIAKQEAYEKKQEQLKQIAPFFIIGFSLFLFILLYYAWRKRRHTLLEVERQFKSTTFVPKELMSMPATIYYYRNFMINHSEMLTVALMDLLRKKLIIQKEKNEYYLVNRKTKHEHEAHLIHLLFDEVGENDIFTFSQLEKYIKDVKNQNHFQKQIHKWLKLILHEVNTHKLLEKHKKLRWITGLTSMLFIPIMVIYGMHALWIYLFIYALLMGAFLLFTLLFQTKTVKGHLLKIQWKQLKDKFNQLQSDYWNTWPDEDKERALLFSIGLNDKKLKQKNKLLIEQFSAPNDNSTLNLLLMIAFYSAASSSFQSASGVSAQSSGATPGTGAGIGGGGGGSGAF